MPYRWNDDQTRLELWAHQSMTSRGFVWFIGATATMFALPLIAVLGTPVLWVLLLFFAAAVAAVWRAIMANRRARDIRETFTLTEDHARLVHQPPRGPAKSWEANRAWIAVHLRDDGPVERYLTLTGGGREVELGAFLTPEERSDLHDDLARRLAR